MQLATTSNAIAEAQAIPPAAVERKSQRKHQPQWSYAREREVCSCGDDLPCVTAALTAPTQPLHTLIGDRGGTAPLLTAAWRQLLLNRS